MNKSKKIFDFENLEKLEKLEKSEKTFDFEKLEKLNKLEKLEKTFDLKTSKKSQKLEKNKKLIFKDSYIDKSILLIVLGPTASGKGSLPTKISKYLAINNKFKEGNYKSILIDDLVEKNIGYIEDINNYLDDLLKKNTVNEFKDIIKNSHKHIDIIKKFGYFYTKHRHCTDCIKGTSLYNFRDTNRDKCNNFEDNTIFKKSNFTKITSRMSKRVKLSCDELNDKNLDQAIKNNNNILLETTGTKFPNWLFKNYEKELVDYKIIMAWSVLDICELIKRNKSRALNQFNQWLIEKTKGTNINSIPRLPDIRFEIYKKDLEEIIQILINFIKENEKNNKFIGNNKIKILIFDNSNQDSYIIYDNEMSTNIKYITNEVYKRYNILRKKCN